MEDVGSPPPLARVGQQVLQRMWAQEQWGVVTSQVQKLEVELLSAVQEQVEVSQALV